ncbi:cyclin N-terminal domain-containing protein 1 isoform X1 [Neodiprion pinetum]|uniref:cyclin N-terminal domain-containing protein 1 isoform X1 n=1 Tax=Neodiprion pinetum TaxID=441929 RepID=UPI001EDFC7CA|nr:cyclin N-terminal domain-containing protein 1-like isoform X1 [Neodiprion pinetum]
MCATELPRIMDLDTAYIEPLIKEWLQHVHEDNARQEQIFVEGSEFFNPFIAVPVPVMKAIFVITDHLGLGPNTRYLTVHLFDRFMSNQFCELYVAEMVSNPGEVAWPQICKIISSEAKLRLMSCMQLASKMDSHTKGLSISQVVRGLRWLDDKSEYTTNSIYCSEFRVYKALDFKIPLFTPLHCVEILLAATKLGQMPKIYDACVNLLDLAYLEHERLYSCLVFLMKQRFSEFQIDPGYIMALESNVLYLAAAVVLCATFILAVEHSETERLVQMLSNQVGIRVTNIWEMANLLFTIALQEDTPEQ